MRKTDYVHLRFSGPFGDLAREYIQQNRALGYKYNVDAIALMQFDAWCV